MKNMKKLFSLALALVMMMALVVTAGAAGTGSITVENASKGEEYKLVKLFDASYNETTKAIVYTGDIPADFTVTEKNENGEDVSVTYKLNDFFTKDAQGYISAKTSAVGEDGKLTVDAVNAIKAWATAQTGITKKADGKELVFDNLDYGYYVVVSRSGNAAGGAISVTSTMPDAVISDKNDIDEPGFPEGSGKVVNNKTVAVGETVTYTITYNATNWIDKNGDPSDGAEAQVTAYAFSDSLPDFLDDVTVTSIVVTDADGDHIISNPPQFTPGYDLPIMVGWADHSYDEDMNAVYTSKYTNGAVIKITYTAVVNEKVLEADEANHKNTITGYPVTPGGNGPEDHAEANVYTASLVIDKYVKGNKNTKLEGAKFVLSCEFESKDAANTGWRQVTTKYCLIGEDGAISWVDSWQNATEVTTDDKGAAKFEGLAKGTYYLVETEAPDGYNKLADPIEVTVGEAEKANVTVTQGVENSTGTELPATGGIGTTIFTVTGAILMIGAAVLFLTKKRSEA